MIWFVSLFNASVSALNRVMKSIDDVLHLSQIFGQSQRELGILVVEFIFSVVGQLLDASLEDEGLLELTPEKNSRWEITYGEMDLDRHRDNDVDIKKTEKFERMQNANTVMATEMIGQFLQDKTCSRLLYLARKNL